MLTIQVRVKTERLKKLKDGTDQLEKNEQRCLAEELAEARKRYLESKAAGGGALYQFLSKSN